MQRPGTSVSVLYRSNDAGANRFAVNTGLTDLMVTSLAVHPANPSIVYAGTLNTLLIIGAPPWSGSGVLRTTDGGANWTPSGTGLGDAAVGALAIERLSPWTLFAGTMGGSTFGSRRTSRSSASARRATTGSASRRA